MRWGWRLAEALGGDLSIASLCADRQNRGESAAGADAMGEIGPLVVKIG